MSDLPFLNPADILKIGLIAWIMIYAINSLLRYLGLASFTTTGS